MRAMPFSLVPFLLAAGCASSSNPSPDAHSYVDAVVHAIDSFSFPDMAPPDAPLPDARPPDGPPFFDAAPPVADEGIVLLANVAGDDNALWTSTVKFVKGSESGLSVWGRPIGTAGDCTAYTEVSDGGYSAGPITTFGLGSGHEITWTPSGAAGHVTYSASTIDGPPFSSVTFMTFWLQAADAGYDVAQFYGSVVGPHAQGWITGLGSSFSRSVPLAMGWTVTYDKMLLVIRSVDAGTSEAVSVVCRFTDADGTYTVPETALASLPVGTQGTIYLYRTYEDDVTAGTFQVATIAGSAVKRIVSITP